MFNTSTLKKAEELVSRHSYEDFSWGQTEARAIVGKGRGMGRAVIRNPPASYDDEWEDAYFSCSCSQYRGRRSSRYDDDYFDPFPDIVFGRKPCVHEAALLLLWERARGGPWRFQETPEEMHARLEQERIGRLIEEENSRWEKIREKEEKIEQPAALFFPGDVPDGLYFDVQKAVQAFRTTHYRLMRAEDLRGRGKIHMNPPKLSYGRDGRQTLSTKATIVDVLDDYIVRQWETTVTLTFSGLSVHGCCHPLEERSHSSA